jgi:hypothetical protein
MVLGAYYLTDDYGVSENIVAVFDSLEEVKNSYDRDNIDIKDRVKVKFNGEFVETSV